VSVFSKLFGSFWLALALSIAATVLIYPPNYHNFAAHRSLLRDSMRISAEQLADRYVECGRIKTEQTLQRLNRENNVTIAIYDDNGELVAGPDDKNLQARAATLANDPPTLNEKQTVTMPLRVRAHNGDFYRVVALIPGNFSTHADDWILISYRLCVLALISGLVCYLLARYLTKPIIVLRDVTRRLASGDLKARAEAADPNRTDEISSLVHDFNHMAAKLDSLMTAQKRLVSDVSHELRSPLARLNVALDLARSKNGADLERSLDRIELEAERLSEMISKLLRLSEMEAALAPDQHQVVNLTQLVRSVCEDSNFEAQSSRRSALLTRIDDCWCRGDRLLLHSAIENVVRNAIRYTAEDTPIELSLERRERKAIFTVRDHGPGLPEEELANIFQPFYRLAFDRGRDSGGVGLGLSITERCIRLHGGSTRAYNAKGGGLSLEIELPALETEEG